MTERKPARAGKTYRRGMKLLRRVHLYSGLFLLPWVLVYGISGYFFNHPDQSGTGTQQITAPDELVAWPEAEDLARRVVAELRTEGEPALQLIDGSAELHGRFIWQGEHADGPASISWTPGSVEASFRVRPRRPARTRSATWIRPKLPLGDIACRDPREIGAGLASLVEVGSVRMRGGPRLRFQARREGVSVGMEYDLSRGRLREHEAQGPGFERFLKRLHTIHVYPSEFGFRWLWALLVDLTAVSMVLWGLSGLMMWWQIKTLRRVGFVVLLGCLVVATPMIWGLYGQFAS